MHPYKEDVLVPLHAAEAQARTTRKRLILIDPAHERLDDPGAFTPSVSRPPGLAPTEAPPHLHDEAPGPSGIRIETHPKAGHAPALPDAPARRPSPRVIGWLDGATRIDSVQTGHDTPARLPARAAAQGRRIVAGTASPRTAATSSRLPCRTEAAWLADA